MIDKVKVMLSSSLWTVATYFLLGFATHAEVLQKITLESDAKLGYDLCSMLKIIVEGDAN